MGLAGETTFTTVPVVDVRDTELMGTLKLRKDTPVGGASVTVTLKFAVPGGVVVPLGRPLQELRTKTVRTSRIEKPRELRFM